MQDRPNPASPIEVPVAILQALRHARHVLVFTGAGMSAESGIPTFRDAMHGLWAEFDPQQLASPEGWAADPERVWAWYEWRRHLVSQAQPHAGHQAVAALAGTLGRAQRRVVTVTVVTQNVDNLHERAGSVEVCHLHGSLFAARCDRCAAPAPFPQAPPQTAVARLTPPPCPACGQGRLRPGVVWFGEMLPAGAWSRAEALARTCDVMLVVGTSGVVYPAAGLPRLARAAGATLVELNPQPSDLTPQVHLFWSVAAATGLSALQAALDATASSGASA